MNNLTSGEILQEYAKCLMNPTYAIETYFKTFDKTYNEGRGGFVQFYLFPRQRQIIQAYELHRFNLVTKPRQAGVSTTTAAYLAIKVGFASDESPEKILILANKRDMAEEFLAKIKDFLLQLPRWVWGEDYYGDAEKEAKSIFLVDSNRKLMLPNKCEIKAVATSKDALRGFTPTYLVMDEAAFIDNGDEVFGAALTSLGTGGKATLISTPNGYDELYWKSYDGSLKGDNDFNVVEMKWYEDNRYNIDLKWLKGEEVITEMEFTFESYKSKLDTGYKPTSSWYEAMCRGMNGDKRMIAQELDVSFLGSGGQVIDDEFIEFHVKNNCKEPQYLSGIKKEIWIWEKPIEGHRYIMGVDVSSGGGDDFSTFVIIDFTTMEEVAEYRGKVPPDLLAKIVEEYGLLYNAYVVVDVTGGWGVSTVLKLIEVKYKNIHYSERNKLLDQKDLAKHVMDDDKKPGLVVNSIRLPLIGHLEQSIRQNLVKIRSIRLTSEMKTFVYRDGRPDHMKGHHDDLLMALGMALWVLEHSFKNLEKVQNQAKAMLKSWVVNGGKNTTDEYNTGFVPKGSKTPMNKPKFTPIVSKNMQDPKGDYLWLFSGMR
jgi:hypothetical protein